MQQFHPRDLVGFSRMVVDATLGVTDIVEAVHKNIAKCDIADLVYDSVRGVTQFVGGAIDALAPVIPPLNPGILPSEREAVVAALNVVIGATSLEQKTHSRFRCGCAGRGSLSPEGFRASEKSWP